MERKEDCVLLKKDMPDTSPHSVMFQVRDIENDIIYMGYIYDEAVKVFKEYDIKKVRKERKDVFLEWLNEFAKA
jgi:hypothetical protein